MVVISRYLLGNNNLLFSERHDNLVLVHPIPIDTPLQHPFVDKPAPVVTANGGKIGSVDRQGNAMKAQSSTPILKNELDNVLAQPLPPILFFADDYIQFGVVIVGINVEEADLADGSFVGQNQEYFAVFVFEVGIEPLLMKPSVGPFAGISAEVLIGFGIIEPLLPVGKVSATKGAVGELGVHGFSISRNTFIG
jgi:hypothetical protein